MKLIVETQRTAPLVAFSIAARGGSAADPNGKEGLLHHAAELSRRGAGSRSRHELDLAIDQMGADLDINVDRDFVTLSGIVLERHLDQLFELALDVLTRPQMTKKEHEKLLRETYADLNDIRDDDGELAARFFGPHVFPGHAAGRTVVGTTDSLERLKTGLDECKETIVGRFTRDDVIVGFAGDIDESRAQTLCARLAAALPDEKAASFPPFGPPDSRSGRALLLVDKPERHQSHVVLGHPIPGYAEDDFAPLLAAETIFGGMFSSRLVHEIRSERGWSYGVGSYLARGSSPRWLQIDMAPATDVTASALEVVFELLERFSRDGPTEEELSLAQKYLVGGLPFSRATARQRLSNKIRLALHGLSETYPDEMVYRIRDMTLAEVKAAAANWFCPKSLAVVVVATASDLERDLQKSGWFESLDTVRWDSY